MGTFFEISNLIMQLLPTLFSAVNTVQKDSGKSWEQVVIDVISHLTPGSANSPALS